MKIFVLFRIPFYIRKNEYAILKSIVLLKNKGGKNLLQVTSLTFFYNKQKILDNINFEIMAGEVVCLAGPNGSGKTTLIKNIMNILFDDSSKITINHIENTDLKAQKMMMYLSSESYLPEFLTGKEYIHLMCKMYHITVNEPLLLKLTEYYSMGEKFNHIIESYSHGMKKKIQLIGGFLIQPPLLIIDETLNGIDMEAREVTKELIHKYTEKGNAILLCTHDFSLVEELEARAVLLNEGAIQYDSKEYLKEEESISKLFSSLVLKEVKQYDLD
ncbi:ATP-binding cassette domain-containing protein [Listeria fleischmannii]|uniref:ATP-binding cassette domain-containing protein n=1 Tax=Listeria fleischmannii TaxID=1069827 RepID=UPI00162810BB|nr:ABC transporter ATP-binding protein [Listeria fleischmannii]MBC1417910.1 ABC transporter ATP-binding protein [Listeria fleischmannii]